jgi:acyl-CoA thioester hydrolase
MGVAYHTHYLVWCEVGRTDYLRELGSTYAELERAGFFLVVAEVHIRYLAPARYDDAIRVDTRLVRVQSRAVTFTYELLREGAGGDTRLAVATTKLLSLGPDGAPRALPEELIRRFREVLAVSLV